MKLRFYSEQARDAYEAGCEAVDRRKAAAWFRVYAKLEQAAAARAEKRNNSFPPTPGRIFHSPQYVSNRFNPWRF